MVIEEDVMGDPYLEVEIVKVAPLTEGDIKKIEEKIKNNKISREESFHRLDMSRLKNKKLPIFELKVLQYFWEKEKR